MRAARGARESRLAALGAGAAEHGGAQVVRARSITRRVRDLSSQAADVAGMVVPETPCDIQESLHFRNDLGDGSMHDALAHSEMRPGIVRNESLCAT